MQEYSIWPWQMFVLRSSRLMDKLWDLRRRRGLSIALLGPDGAGKSTLAMGIQHSFVFPVRLVYMGLTGGLLRHIARLHVPGLVFLEIGRASCRERVYIWLVELP